MSKAPSMPMYWDAYIADTTHLSCEEHGAYLMLLGAMWRRDGSVPDDDKDNARILKISTIKWRKMKARFVATIPNFIVVDNHITQEKLKKTWEKTQNLIQVNRKNGAMGGHAKANNNNDLDLANATISQSPISTIPEPEPEPRDTKVSMSKKEKVFDLFWNNCPKKTAKGAARKAFEKAIQKADPELIIYSMQKYKEERAGQEKRYTAHPATWLNAERWDDEETTEINIYDHIEGITNGTETRSIDANSIDNTESIKQLAPMGDTAASETRGSDRTDPPSGGRYQREVSGILRQGKYKR